MKKILSIILVLFLSVALFGQTLHTLQSDAEELDVSMYNTLLQRYPSEIEELKKNGTDLSSSKEQYYVVIDDDLTFIMDSKKELITILGNNVSSDKNDVTNIFPELRKLIERDAFIIQLDSVPNDIPEFENLIIINRNGVSLAAFQDAKYPMTEEFVDEINRCYPDDAKELSEKGYDGETLTDGYFESFVTITVRIIHDADGNIIHILEGDDFKKFFE